MKKNNCLWKKVQYNERDDSKISQHETIVVATNGDVVIDYNDGSINLVCHPGTWVVDFDASYHVTSLGEFFTSYKGNNYGYVRMKNKGSSKIVCIWDIFIEIGTQRCQTCSIYPPQLDIYWQTR